MKTKEKFYAVIMAGGSGTRFWPLSRKGRPKQFLPMVGRKTMIEETVERLRPLFPYPAITTISNKAQAKAIHRLLPRLPVQNLLAEPRGRNTAASLILATAWVYRRNPEAVVAALPADHLITRPEVFRKKLEAAGEKAAKKDVIVTFGIPPTYPATGFGYIHFSKSGSQKAQGEIFYPVLKFKEKPDLEQAKAFLVDGKHNWNSGMFIWRADVFAHKLEKYASEFFPCWVRILRALEKRDRPEIAAVFDEIPATSIDYALMEKAEGVLMCEGDFGWSDVGSWSSLADVWPRDEDGNAVRGKALPIDSRHCLIYSPHKLAAIVGLENMIVVDADDALLVCPKEADQRVREIIEALKKKGLKRYL